MAALLALYASTIAAPTQPTLTTPVSTPVVLATQDEVMEFGVRGSHFIVLFLFGAVHLSPPPLSILPLNKLLHPRQAWARMFERDYDDEERETRQQVYADTVALIQKHNAEADAGAHSFRLGVNQFSDMTSSEWATYALSPTEYPVKPDSERNVEILAAAAPDAAVDWRTKGAVTPVKNQGGCVRHTHPRQRNRPHRLPAPPTCRTAKLQRYHRARALPASPPPSPAAARRARAGPSPPLAPPRARSSWPPASCARSPSNSWLTALTRRATTGARAASWSPASNTS